MNETRTDDAAAPAATTEDTALGSADRTVLFSPAPPPHAVAAVETYLAELDDLLAHLAAHPDQRWVAYRSRERLGFGTDHLALLLEWRTKFPDGLFTVYGINACHKYPNDVVV